MKRLDNRGVTLLELLIVIAIMAVTAGFVSVSKDMIKRARITAVTQQLLADIQNARIHAMTHDAQGFGIRFQSAKSYVTFRFNDCNDSDSYDVYGCAGRSREETDATVKNIPAGAVLKKTNPATNFNNNVLIFDQAGVSRSATWAFGNMTIIVKNDRDENGMQCITVSATRVYPGVWGWDRKAREFRCIGG